MAEGSGWRLYPPQKKLLTTYSILLLKNINCLFKQGSLMIEVFHKKMFNKKLSVVL